MPSPSPLGDSHNFGRRVERRGGRIVKPRTVVWERLLLDAESPLRRVLGRALGPLDFLPDLKFSPAPEGPGGEVDAVRLEPLGTAGAGASAREKTALARVTGKSLGLWSWLGVSDLHWENLVLGRGERGQLVFSPLDVESLLDDFAAPTETKLLPDADPEYAAVCRHACGVRRVLPFLGKPIEPLDLLAMAAAYLGTLGRLDRHRAEIASAFARMEELRTAPIRVCLRGTNEYVEARTGPAWPPLLEAEEEQMARGDIPYFFRLYGQPGIHYYGEESLEEFKTLPRVGDVPQLEPLLSVERNLASPHRQSLREQGLFTLLAAFDDPSFEGVFRHEPERARSADEGEALEVEFARQELVVTLPGGEELACSRELGDFVSSVYLPCRCGEVSSVFVPAVTRCEPDAAF
ncbi:MAG: hypothetical protein AAF725_02870 [Acidobacteriota bacterium]